MRCFAAGRSAPDGAHLRVVAGELGEIPVEPGRIIEVRGPTTIDLSKVAAVVPIEPIENGVLRLELIGDTADDDQGVLELHADSLARIHFTLVDIMRHVGRLDGRHYKVVEVKDEAGASARPEISENR